VIRLIWGISFIFAGISKFGDMGGTITGFESLNIPYPVISAWLVAFGETIGGALLVLGLFTRLGALGLAAIMVGALSTAHIDVVTGVFSNPAGLLNEKAFNFLIAVLTLMAFGPGFFSLDALWGRRKNSV